MNNALPISLTTTFQVNLMVKEHQKFKGLDGSEFCYANSAPSVLIDELRPKPEPTTPW